MKDRVYQLSERQRELTQLIAEAPQEAAPLLHPNMAQRYHSEVQNLLATLNDPAQRAGSI